MISILIPFKNEIENILQYNKTLFYVVNNVMIMYNLDYEYIFIDDGSTDKGFESLINIAKLQEHNHVSVLSRHETSQGVGYAIRKGLADCKGDYVIIMDADLTYRPYDILILLRRLLEKPDADCISGSPYMENKEIKSSKRIYGSRFFNKIFYILLNKRVTCVTGMFRLYKTSAIKNMWLTSNDFNINTEIMLKLLNEDKKVYEVPVTLHERDKGESKMNVPKEVTNEIKLILKVIGKKVFREQMTI